MTLIDGMLAGCLFILGSAESRQPAVLYEQNLWPFTFIHFHLKEEKSYSFVTLRVKVDRQGASLIPSSSSFQIFDP